MFFVKRRFPVEAVQYRKDTVQHVFDFCGGALRVYESTIDRTRYFEVETPEGFKRGTLGDYIIRDEHDHLDVIKQDDFVKDYIPFSYDGLTFGEAIKLAKEGHRIARKGWNGKNMFVVYQKGYPDGIPCNENTAKAFGYEVGSLFKCRPYLQMRCADGTHQMWIASQSDILEEDWYVVKI